METVGYVRERGKKAEKTAYFSHATMLASSLSGQSRRISRRSSPAIRSSSPTASYRPRPKRRKRYYRKPPCQQSADYLKMPMGIMRGMPVVSFLSDTPRTSLVRRFTPGAADCLELSWNRTWQPFPAAAAAAAAC
jgi:hypothetical protein